MWRLRQRASRQGKEEPSEIACRRRFFEPDLPDCAPRMRDLCFRSFSEDLRPFKGLSGNRNQQLLYIFIPASTRICDRIGASGHIPVKHLANSNGSRYTPSPDCAKLTLQDRKSLIAAKYAAFFYAAKAHVRGYSRNWILGSCQGAYAGTEARPEADLLPPLSDPASCAKLHL